MGGGAGKQKQKTVTIQVSSKESLDETAEASAKSAASPPRPLLESAAESTSEVARFRAALASAAPAAGAGPAAGSSPAAAGAAKAADAAESDVAAEQQEAAAVKPKAKAKTKAKAKAKAAAVTKKLEVVDANVAEADAEDEDDLLVTDLDDVGNSGDAGESAEAGAGAGADALPSRALRLDATPAAALVQRPGAAIVMASAPAPVMLQRAPRESEDYQRRAAERDAWLASIGAAMEKRADPTLLSAASPKTSPHSLKSRGKLKAKEPWASATVAVPLRERTECVAEDTKRWIARYQSRDGVGQQWQHQQPRALSLFVA
eukprot:TRINITY_DN6236_c0_g1_i1.p1 TRINITY_DN6236_c0_g1~~TRINITY_DN6236_c0_g1_i1.p1  ORF type:complete len:336 (-),score=110.99 TRINITY_DN6236_c0_g1_i1:167-1120(-)